jgi:hypothetical protein
MKPPLADELEKAGVEVVELEPPVEAEGRE